MVTKERLDVLLVEKGFFASREKAKGAVMAGLVQINNQRVDKPGSMVPVDADIKVAGPAIPYVSRGGLKLEKALREFQLQLAGKVVMDIGASTGGFTDCALQNGAAKVYAVDVGYGQLAWSLRQDPRVVNLERTNIRNLTADKLPEQVDFVTIDVAFISLGKVLPKAYELSSPEAKVVALIKPQFEAGRDKVGKKGVVKDPAVHMETISKVIDVARELGFRVCGLSYSPIKGPEGNIEYLLFLTKQDDEVPVDVKETVRLAHAKLP